MYFILKEFNIFISISKIINYYSKVRATFQVKYGKSKLCEFRFIYETFIFTQIFTQYLCDQNDFCSSNTIKSLIR